MHHKLCVWMNIPSHYQSAFFNALHQRPDVDLRVVYFEEPSALRAAEGWNTGHETMAYEQFLPREAVLPENMVDVLDDWESYIHVIGSQFCPELVDYFCTHGARWCHWSEMPGIRLAEVVDFRMTVFRFLKPFMLMVRRAEGQRIKEYALGAYGQGYLARKAFRLMRIPAKKMADLFYVPGALPRLDPSSQVREFAGNRKVFLAVGALCKRKGVDVLLKAFARVRKEDWCLVFCGLDRSDGQYSKLGKQLNIADQVLFLGAYPVERIAEVYGASDVFVLPSRFDGWGAVLNEAASLSMPLIGTDLCGASWHLIDEGRNGYRVKADSVSGLARAMGRYVDEPALIEKHGRKSHEIFFKEFTPEANAERMMTALNQWVGK